MSSASDNGEIELPELPSKSARKQSPQTAENETKSSKLPAMVGGIERHQTKLTLAEFYAPTPSPAVFHSDIDSSLGANAAAEVPMGDGCGWTSRKEWLSDSLHSLKHTDEIQEYLQVKQSSDEQSTDPQQQNINKASTATNPTHSSSRRDFQHINSRVADHGVDTGQSPLPGGFSNHQQSDSSCETPMKEVMTRLKNDYLPSGHTTSTDKYQSPGKTSSLMQVTYANKHFKRSSNANLSDSSSIYRPRIYHVSSPSLFTQLGMSREKSTLMSKNIDFMPAQKTLNLSRFAVRRWPRDKLQTGKRPAEQTQMPHHYNKGAFLPSLKLLRSKSTITSPRKQLLEPIHRASSEKYKRSENTDGTTERALKLPRTVTFIGSPTTTRVRHQQSIPNHKNQDTLDLSLQVDFSSYSTKPPSNRHINIGQITLKKESSPMNLKRRNYIKNNNRNDDFDEFYLPR